MSRRFPAVSTYLVSLYPFARRFLTTKMMVPPSAAVDPIVPTGVRGMTVLDRKKFARVLQVPILKVDVEELSTITVLCKPFLLKLQNFKPIQDYDDETFSKCIHLNPVKIKEWVDFPESTREELAKVDVSESNLCTKEIRINYHNFMFNTIFKAVLPEGEDIVSGFSQIGHVVHLNLRDHLLEYRNLIGQVLHDKIKSCRTVVNKTGIIDNTYRNFSMEVVAGEHDFVVAVKENNCIYGFDFSKVYWNPRLGKEHERIVCSVLKPGDVLFDVFCGVGPFAIPAAKKKCKVFANDLNPESYKWLNINANTNKVKDSLFKSYNQDGKDFICNVFKDYIVQYCEGVEKLDEGATIRVTMNLPGMAVQFLKYFNGLIKNEELLTKLDREILIYVYCFVSGDNPVEVSKQLIIQNIGCDVSEQIIDIFDVRNVSPKKEMMRITLKLTNDVICGKFEKKKSIENSEPPCKKACVTEC